MKTSTKGRQFIEKFEGLILSAYDDVNDKIVDIGSKAKGTITIGYGHTTAAGAPRVYVGQTISAEEADRILSSDLYSVEIEVGHLVKVDLNQNQFDALVSFQFNTGALGRSSLLTKLNNGEYKEAANEFFKWNKAGGKVLDGLIRRRREEASVFLTPVSTIEAKPIATYTSLTDLIIGLFKQLFNKKETK